MPALSVLSCMTKKRLETFLRHYRSSLRRFALGYRYDYFLEAQDNCRIPRPGNTKGEKKQEKDKTGKGKEEKHERVRTKYGGKWGANMCTA